jgi:hypothetical protein
MIQFKYYALILSVSFIPLSSYAFLGTADASLSVSYACLGLDGLPISRADLASQCCDGNGNLKSGASDNCRTSLYGAGTAEATSGVGSSLNIASQTLSQHSDLSGASTNLEVSGTPAETGNTDTSSSQGSALTSSDGSSVGTGTNTTGASTSGKSEGGSGSGGSGSGAGGSGGSTVGTTGAGAAGKTGVTSEAPGEDSAGKYSAAAGKDSGAGSGSNVGGLFGSLFGNNKDKSDAMNDATFGNQTADGKAKEDADGSAVDPSDYFNRIDKSASIFKVVSTRYAKETERKHIGIPEMTK